MAAAGPPADGGSYTVTRMIEDTIAAVAARQYGVVTRDQLLDAGLSRSAVGRRLGHGRLRRIHRGIYLVGPLMPPHALEMAAVFAGRPRAVVSHLSAARLWGLAPPPDPPRREPVDITLVANRGRRPGIRAHRVATLPADHWTVRQGIPLTTPPRTLVDLAGVVGTRELEGAVARAEREGLVTWETLSALVARHRGRPGLPALREVLEARGAPALTRSEAEERFLGLVRDAGLPAPETNVRIGRYEIDFLWRDHGIAVEVDGYRHHSTRPRFEGDRRKDARLMAAGIHVLRLTWRQITRESLATAVQVGQALARARK